MKNLIRRIKQLIEQNREVVAYLFFGGMTTLVNFLSYALLHDLFRIRENVANGIGWFVSVLFAFVTNKKYVFNDRSATFADWTKKLASFFGCRALSGAFDIITFSLLVPYINDYLLKILISVVVIILNYIFSKLWVFRKKATEKSNP